MAVVESTETTCSAANSANYQHSNKDVPNANLPASSQRKSSVERIRSKRRVAIIGAGAAGLVAARELVREGHNVVIYEQGQQVAGVWVYDEKVESDPLGIDPNRVRVHGSLYASLRTNLPREIMGYLDYPFLPKQEGGVDVRRYPNHREVCLYLKSFAKDFDLLSLVKFGAKVEYVGREEVKGDADNLRWVVKVGSSGDTQAKAGSGDGNDLKHEEQEMEKFDAVVVCKGKYADSFVVPIPGVESWPGLQIHSHNYRFPDPFEDQVVVVIGSANSAQDITREVAQVAKEVHQSARAWTSTERPTALEAKTNNIWHRPMIERAHADGTIDFRDKTSVVADAIIHCTGYFYSFPFLDTKGYVSVEDNRVGPLYKHVFPPALAPSLSFVGVPWKVVPFPLMELQSRWIAKLLSGHASLPPETEMMADIKNFYAQLDAQQIPKSYTHNCSSYQFEYVDWLAEQSGHEPVEAWRKGILFASAKNRLAHVDKYRDEWEDQHLLDEAMAALKKLKNSSKGCLC